MEFSTRLERKLKHRFSESSGMADFSFFFLRAGGGGGVELGDRFVEDSAPEGFQGVSKVEKQNQYASVLLLPSCQVGGGGV